MAIIVRVGLAIFLLSLFVATGFVGAQYHRRHHHFGAHHRIGLSPFRQQQYTWIVSNATRRFVIDDLRDHRISAEAEQLSGQELVDYVNSHQTLWKAKLGKFESYTNRVRYGMLGVEHVALSVKQKQKLAPSRFMDNVYIPENFDARTVWDECDSIKNIRDQSSCGSCWAFGAVEAMSDRICIASKGKIKVTLSSDDLLSCCKSCGFGCNGGEPLEAWEYWVHQGIVTGSNYTSHQGCRPYPFPPCEHHSNKTHYQPCKHDLYPTPKCVRRCQNGYEKQYNDDKYYGKSAYAVENDVQSIQKELMAHGPAEASFEVYTDFLTYSSGIYKHTAGSIGGGHAVKLIGWGIEQGVPYWTLANSWNTDFGENGFFRIVRGVDECGIESGIVGGVPHLERDEDFRHTNKFKPIKDDDDGDDFKQ